jgi:hypothetical protein
MTELQKQVARETLLILLALLCLGVTVSQTGGIGRIVLYAYCVIFLMVLWWAVGEVDYIRQYRLQKYRVPIGKLGALGYAFRKYNAYWGMAIVYTLAFMAGAAILAVLIAAAVASVDFVYDGNLAFSRYVDFFAGLPTDKDAGRIVLYAIAGGSAELGLILSALREVD